jgi:hypothetical protein
MEKSVISEGVIDSFLLKIFDAILHRKKNIIMKAAARDPEVRRQIEQLESNVEELRTYLKTHAKSRSGKEIRRAVLAPFD